MKKKLSILLLGLLLSFSLYAGNELYVQVQSANAKEIIEGNFEPTKTKTEVTNDLKLSVQKETITPDNETGLFSITVEKILLGLLAISEVVVRLVPSVKDNSIVNFFTRLINFLIPNVRKDGGTF